MLCWDMIWMIWIDSDGNSGVGICGDGWYGVGIGGDSWYAVKNPS